MSYLDSYPLHKTMRIIFYRDDIQRRIHTAQLSISLFLKVLSGIISKCVSSLCYAVTHDINLVDSTTLPRPLSIKLINLHNLPVMPALVATLAIPIYVASQFWLTKYESTPDIQIQPGFEPRSPHSKTSVLDTQQRRLLALLGTVRGSQNPSLDLLN